MECAADCGCGNHCQNQRFTHKHYADVSVIKTEKKGYGLRANTDLAPNQFIFEYIGEVIGEAAFRKRMQTYDAEGIKHFYFMSLTKGEFVDATRKGNLGRFCNHSCNPNCYVDKWVVGEKLRMGIFSERKIKAGEELVFNYNVDRYGADPQPCYCDEPNCTGFIGGKTQTERGTKLSKATIEALGIDDADSWDTAVARKPRKKKGVDEDEEYVNNLEPKELEEAGVRSVMAQLPQCKEKWIAVKLLSRIQRATDSAVVNQVVRMHGYRHLKTALGNFSDDVNVSLQILDVLNKLPRITRNKIQDSKIEDAVQLLVENEDERVAAQSKALLEIWSKLEVGYRIPRVKRDPNAATPVKLERVDRRDEPRRRSRSRTPEKINAPTGPRSAPARPRPPPRFRPPPPSGPLPAGWFQATAPNGTVYYYDQSGNTSWQRPAKPSGPVPPPPPPKIVSDQQMLQELIQNIVASKKEPIKAASEAPAASEASERQKKEDRWKTYPEDKQKKIYEGLVQPHVQHVVNKFKHKLEKDDLKRLAKEISKKIVNSDFKNNQVKSLSSIDDRHARKLKKHVHETFEKAVRKKADHDKKKLEKKGAEQSGITPVASPPAADDDLPQLSDDEDQVMKDAPITEADTDVALKRVRDDEQATDDMEESAAKRLRSEQPDEAALPPPPPPPPPPAESMDATMLDADTAGPQSHGHLAEAQEPYSNGVEDDSNRYTSLSRSDVTQTATPPTTGSPDESELVKSTVVAEASHAHAVSEQ